MSAFLELMAAPFAACLVLTGIHAYLGLHVLEREVIFVDLALAQVAALGSTFALLWGLDLHSSESYVLSLVFAVLGAAIFAATRRRKPVVPQEAFIGIVYAVAASASILVLSRSAHGGEELQEIMVGHLLFVDWTEIAKIAAIYALIGWVHWLARGPFLAISRDPGAAFASGLRVRWWDFLFYVTFALVVTSSVELAGVLLVFSFLIVPAVCAKLLVQGTGRRLFVGWAVGAVTSMVGVAASYAWDLPTGATVVCAFGVCFAVCALLRVVRRPA